MNCNASKPLVAGLALLVALPIFVVLFSWAFPTNDIWLHFYHTILSQLITSTAILLLSVALGVTLLGTILAYLVVMVEFPGRKFFDWALFLPFAIPAYVLAFVYLGVFDYSGVAQVFLREQFGVKGFDIRSGHLAIVLTFVLAFYPYVYMMARASFKKQKINLLQASELLGASHLRTFFLVSIPLARPAIAAGVLITMMETMADFGVVGLFNYDTFTTAIYSAWIDFRSLQAAAQLASFLVLLAFLLMYFERKSRGNAQYYASEMSQHCYYKPTKKTTWLITGFVFFVFFIAFILPIAQLLIWAISEFSETFEWLDYLELLTSSLILIVLAVVFILSISIFLVLNNCLKQNRSFKILVRIASLGYALPGSIMAVGLLFLVNQVSNISLYFGGISINHLIYGSLFLLLFAYVSRFLAIGFNSVEASFKQIKPVFTQNAQILGSSALRTTFSVHLPMMFSGIIAGGLLIAVDVMKELPATYLLRPFGWDTLAIKVYELSSEGLFEQAALPALIMILLGVLFVFFAKKLDTR